MQLKRNPFSILSIVPALVIVVSLLLACGGGEKPVDLAAGKTVYKTYCVACHGIDGKLNLNGAKDFTTSILTHPERKNIITNGKGLMTPFKEVLSVEEIEAVAAYTMELTKGKQ